MNTLIISIIIIGLILAVLGIKKVLFSKEQPEEILPTKRETKLDLIPIPKTTQGGNDSSKSYDFDISTISFKSNEIETLVTLYNNSSKHIKLEILEAYFTLNNQRIEGDYKLRELNMGTNDILLKNTILSQQTLIRNIYFKGIDAEQFSGDSELTIRLIINQEEITLVKTINQSSIKNLQIFTEIEA